MAENPMSASEFKRLRRFVKAFSRLNAWVYRASGGRLLGSFQGRPIVLVTMRGARSGLPRTIPLMYVPHEGARGEGVVLVASQGGAPKSPLWYRNLIAHPEITVQLGARKLQLRARLAEGEEKAALWPLCDKHYPPYADYRKRTDRDIPMFVCEPAGPAAAATPPPGAQPVE